MTQTYTPAGSVNEAAMRLLERAEHARYAGKVWTTVYWQDVYLVLSALHSARGEPDAKPDEQPVVARDLPTPA